jgi:hypothetical protein
MVTEIEQLPPTKQPDNEGGAYGIEIPMVTVIQQLQLTKQPDIEYLDADFAPVMPDEILLGSLRDGRLKVNVPIKVKFTTEGVHTIAEAVEINEFGFGGNMSEAIADLQRTIAELYLTLEEEQKHLGKDLKGVWTVLQKKIHKL